jgi:hypothetical protein
MQQRTGRSDVDVKRTERCANASLFRRTGELSFECPTDISRSTPRSAHHDALA